MKAVRQDRQNHGQEDRRLQVHHRVLVVAAGVDVVVHVAVAVAVVGAVLK